MTNKILLKQKMVHVVAHKMCRLMQHIF